MKYIVMECHPGYSVLMDEDSRFVFAANLRYQVGQTVEQPILMRSPSDAAKPRFSVSVRKVAAAAACLLLLVGTEFLYYRSNVQVYSIIVFSAESDIRIEVNRRGKVLSVRSSDSAGEALLHGYDPKGKDKLTVTNDLIRRAVSSGTLQTGDTVDVYIQTPEPAVYESYKSELEQEISDYTELTPNVQQIDGKSEIPSRETVTETVKPETIPAAAPVQEPPQSDTVTRERDRRTEWASPALRETETAKPPETPVQRPGKLPGVDGETPEPRATAPADVPEQHTKPVPAEGQHGKETVSEPKKQEQREIKPAEQPSKPSPAAKEDVPEPKPPEQPQPVPAEEPAAKENVPEPKPPEQPQPVPAEEPAAKENVPEPKPPEQREQHERPVPAEEPAAQEKVPQPEVQPEPQNRNEDEERHRSGRDGIALPEVPLH